MPSIHCSVCDLSGEPTSLLEAKRWAAIHDQLRHRGHPTAAIVTRRPLLPGSRRRLVFGGSS